MITIDRLAKGCSKAGNRDRGSQELSYELSKSLLRHLAQSRSPVLIAGYLRLLCLILQSENSENLAGTSTTTMLLNRIDIDHQPC